MKQVFILMTAAIILFACGGKKSSGSDAKPSRENKISSVDNSQNPEYQKGLELIGKTDCLTCHKVDEMVTGPAYRDVANKYAGSSDTVVNYLAKKIISGGKGNWGEVFMTPHPNLSQADAEAIVKYILLLKNK